MAARLSLFDTSWPTPYPTGPVIVGLGLLLQIFTSTVHAQVSPITPSGLHTQVSDPIAIGGQTQYDITGGTRPGGGVNLFHSFGDFNVPTNTSANFLNTGSVDLAGNVLAAGLPTHNILARVTDQQNPSMILGMIQTNGPGGFGNANLFLMNPHGFLFGPTATVNVGGMVAFTSADYLRLADGARFNAILEATADALLTASPVATFGFLGSNSAAITVQGTQFTVTDGQSISLVGGDISIGSGTLDGGAAQSAQLSAPNGNIHLASTASPGEFDAQTLQPLPNVADASFTSFGSIALASGSRIDVNGASTVSIRGGQFVLSVDDAALTTALSAGGPDTVALSTGSAIVTATSGTEGGADIQITAANVQIDAASVMSTSSADGFGGDISISGHTIGLFNGGQISSIAESSGAGGTIALTGSESVTISGFDTTFALTGIPNQDGFVTSGVFTTTTSSGAGGSASIDAPMVSLDGGGSLVSAATGSGRGGDLSVTGNTVALTSGGLIRSLSGKIDPITLEAGGSGQGGDITVTATESIHLTGGSLDVFTISGILSNTLFEGTGGNLVVNAPNVTVANSSFLNTSSQGTGTAGHITVEASNLLSVAGVDEIFGVGAAISSSTSGPPSGGGSGAIDIHTRTLRIEDGGSIGTSTGTSAAAGDVTITGETFTILRGAIITGSSQSGSTGTITLNASETITISNPFDPGFPVAVANIQEGSGGQGAIAINAREILVTNGAEVFSSSTGTGAGSVTLEATESITVSANGVVRAFGGTTAERPAINLRAANITLDQGLLSSRTNIDLDGGSISLNAFAGNLSLANGSHVLTNTQFSSGNAGSIVANATDSIVLSGGSTMESSSAAAASGNGGNVTLSAGQSVGMTSNSGISTSSTGTGNAGSIDINAGSQFTMTNSSVTTEATQSGGGAIKITTDPSGTVLLTNSTISASVLDGTGGGGSVNIDPLFVILVNSQILATAIQGAGGNIFITTNLLLPDANSVISASSQFGQNGTVTIQSPNAPISGQIHPLGKTPLLATSLFNQQCASVAGGQFSSFTVAGRNSLPTEPGSWLTSPLATLSTGTGEGLSGLSSLSGVSDVVRARLAAHQIDQADQIDKTDQSPLSLRQIAPAGFLTQAFSVDEPAGCQS